MTSSGWAVSSSRSVQQPPQPADLVLDLRVGPAERGGRVGPAEARATIGTRSCLVGALVREQLDLEPVRAGAHRCQVVVREDSSSATERICSTTGRTASCSARSWTAVATSRRAW